MRASFRRHSPVPIDRPSLAPSAAWLTPGHRDPNGVVAGDVPQPVLECRAPGHEDRRKAREHQRGLLHPGTHHRVVVRGACRVRAGLTVHEVAGAAGSGDRTGLMASDRGPRRRRLDALWPAPRPRPVPERPLPVMAPSLPGSPAPLRVARPPAVQAPTQPPAPVLTHVDDPSLWTIEASTSTAGERSRILQWLVAAAVSFMVAGSVIMLGHIV